MGLLFDSLQSALLLLISLDPELLLIVGVSLKVSGASTVIASLSEFLRALLLLTPVLSASVCC